MADEFMAGRGYKSFELHRPLIEWTIKQVSSGEQTAIVFYNRVDGLPIS
jgi:hypothetical protein